MALLNVDQVMDVLNVRQSQAYQIIRDLNAELKEQGYRVVRGKVEERYLLEQYRLAEVLNEPKNNKN
ncbi:MAG: hypothetical protein GX328_02180 [Clostridiaceae bacterium]|nr:hypothetical protein [Clostridiaceae bacterium]